MLYLKVKVYLFFQEILVLRYYKKPIFALLDIFLKTIYLFFNPYRVSRKFMQKKGSKNIHVYGETPLILFDILLKKCKVSSSDTFLELGCGRGRLCFFASYFYHCNVIGLEQIPLFVKIIQYLQKIFKIKNLKIINKNMFEVDYSKASFIYLYGTCLEDHEIEKIISKINKNTKVLTISIELNDYNLNFQTLEKFSVKLPWGKTNAFLQVKK
jgi:precorrin-6B methylase 2